MKERQWQQVQVADTGFTHSLLDWFAQHGRHDLPWQQQVTPYRVWISEIMLQQTRVSTVIPYFQRFMQQFPELPALAQAELDEVLHLWTGLGYYARARHLHQTAQQIRNCHDGKFPEDLPTLMDLPGIGRSTAGAILSLAFGQRHPILDGNVKRVLTRYHAIDGWPGMPVVERQLWQLADRYTPEQEVSAYTQAIMDLGATVCVRQNPLCGQCPVHTGCIAYKHSMQHSWPHKRPGKKLPVRKTVFAILEDHQGKILLQHRQPTGIWGGLWGFPECSPETDLRHWIENEMGYVINSLEYRDQVRHTFSHFHLDIVPVHARISVSNKDNINDTDQYYWYEPTARKSLGMATPVKKLLNTITMENKG